MMTKSEFPVIYGSVPKDGREGLTNRYTMKSIFEKLIYGDLSKLSHGEM